MAEYNLTVANAALKSGWDCIEINGSNPIFSVNRAINEWLRETGEVGYTLSDSQYANPIEKYKDTFIQNMKARGKSIFNSPKIRLDAEPDGKFELSMTTYFDGLMTNDFLLNETNFPSDIRDDAFATLFPESRIDLLSDSNLSNHIGSAALAFDEEGSLVLCKTTHASAVNGGKLAASAAGSCDASIFNDKGDLKECIKRTMLTELAEETAIRPGTINGCEVLGMARDLVRTGKPEFYGIITVDGKWQDNLGALSNDEKKYTAGHLIIKRQEFETSGLLNYLISSGMNIGHNLIVSSWLFDQLKTMR
jgi:hypothetical protein